MTTVICERSEIVQRERACVISQNFGDIICHGVVWDTVESVARDSSIGWLWRDPISQELHREPGNSLEGEISWYIGNCNISIQAMMYAQVANTR